MNIDAPITSAIRTSAFAEEGAVRNGSAGPRFHRYAILLLIVAIAMLIAMLVALLLLSRNAGREERLVVAPALAVAVVTPRRVNWTNTLTATGTVAPWQEASVGTQIGGVQLNDVRANVGDRVHRGQVLAVLNPALLRAEATRLTASHREAEVNRERALSLKASGAISDQDVLQFETAERTAAALLAGKRLELGYTAVRAPDDGVISARTATLGAVVPVGQELFRLIRRDRLEWRGELTATQIAELETGQRVLLSLPDGRVTEGTIRKVAPMLDDQSRLGLVYADIPRGSPARAGMYAVGQIILGHSPALTVPASSVVVRDGRSYVMKVGGNTAEPRIVQQSVTVARRQAGRVEIVEGLSPSDRVVFEGADFLNDGDIVRVAQSSGRVATR